MILPSNNNLEENKASNFPDTARLVAQVSLTFPGGVRNPYSSRKSMETYVSRFPVCGRGT